jgi:glycosyltransferase involved in cell wall biosynthesis
MKKIGVLHISESFEGGVATAVAGYVDAVNAFAASKGVEISHSLLCNTRSNKLDSGILAKFSTVSDLPKSHFDAIKTARRIIDNGVFDVIHCHSSFGGVYGRIAGRKASSLMVYTPHCYAFERKDVSRVVAMGYRAIEKVLTRWTDVVAGCSERERELALELGAKSAVFVPNYSSLRRTTKQRRDTKKIVVGSGRLAPQKDPEFFANIANRCSGVRFMWIGDGEPRYTEMMAEAGVEVTGWLAQADVRKLMRDADIYLHTALWEGFPMTILDAERCGLAIVAREADYLAGMPKKYIVKSVAGAAKKISSLADDRKALDAATAAWAAALKNNRPEVTGERLFEIYTRQK